MTAIRLPVSFGLALCATTALFWFLGMLVAADPDVTIVPIVPGIAFTEKIPEPVIEPPPIVKPPIVKPEPPPDAPVVEVDRGLDLIEGTDGPSPLFDEGFGDSLTAPTERPQEFAMRAGTDRGAVPQVRMLPEYPEAARARGIEGWITFRFTVARDGSVKDIEILDSRPERVWDSATLRAVSSWKYQPAIKDGKPVEQVGVTATYRYELER
jgi:protein TonB